LRRKRTGEKSAYKYLPQLSTLTQFELFSSSFSNGELIPEKHAVLGRGDDISPALYWKNVPGNTKQLLLVMEDIDVPFSKQSIHVCALFEPDIKELSEGAL
jgi:phosphatidylethanolamine-binding protein (PEBP) family uncharacterized protein